MHWGYATSGSTPSIRILPGITSLGTPKTRGTPEQVMQTGGIRSSSCRKARHILNAVEPVPGRSAKKPRVTLGEQVLGA